ncbi:MAG: thiolase domain-containing protein [Deltaproteobacteria bacterium]|nr:thiolase domain-containing protein [Deltaproteobacteria bacterium]
MGRPVSIIGIGQTKHGVRSDVTYPDLIREAVQAAFANADIGPEKIDGVVFGTMPSMMEGVAMTHFYFAEALGAVGKPMMKTETCGTTGMSLAITGYYWVASGMADIVLVVGSEKMHEGDAQATISTVLEPFFLRPFLVGAPGVFSLVAQLWMERYKIPEETAREAATRLSVDHHNDACDNTYAHIKQNLTADEVNNARIITYPIRLWDVCPASDGACAMIFASSEVANKICKRPAWVKGVGFSGDEYWFGDSDKVHWQAAIDAADQAYEKAGITDPLRQLDVAEVYNPFTFEELVHFECFGFCDPGKAAEATLEGTFSREGALPCNPSGGVLCTNPIGATALIRVAEAALQVTGNAGEHQIEGAKLALAHGLGGVAQFNGVMILGSES